MIIREYKLGDEKGILKLDRILEEHPWNRRNLKIGIGNIKEKILQESL